ncbi:MAG TPA: ATP-binding protein, partial [Saprospiraceae bacterium]|nr:ATP-binding protein [Saprospiraceae bacterium]
NGRKVWLGKFDHEQWQNGQNQFRNCIAMPLIFNGHIIGVIKAENKDLKHGEHFSDEDEKYFEIMANVIAISIENIKYYEKKEKELKIIPAKAAHRIRNQITNYDGIQLDLKEQIGATVLNKYHLNRIADRIDETTSSIKRMVDEFDGFIRPIVINKVPCNINDIIENEVWLAAPPSKIKIEISLNKSIPIVSLDAQRFAEAIKELLRNSMKAVSNNLLHEKDGIISISSTFLDKDKKLIVEIKDNGPGFPVNFPIFEPFQSTDPRSAGLGLAIIKDLVEAHGGYIQALSSRGAHLQITIPFSE